MILSMLKLRREVLFVKHGTGKLANRSRDLV